MSNDRYLAGDFSSKIIREYHKQLFNRAEIAMEIHPMEERDIGGVTLTTDPALIEKAKKKIIEFQGALINFLCSGEKKVVYHFSHQLFKLER